MCWNLNAGHREHRRREIDHAHQLIVHRVGYARAHGGPPDHERHAEPGVVERSLRPRHAVAVIRPIEDDGVVGEPVRFELVQNLADLPVHVGDVVVHARELLADERRIGVIRRDDDPCGICDERLSFSRGARRENLALVGDLEVEDRKERLTLVRSTTPMRPRAEIVPDGKRDAELVVGLRAIAGVIPRRAQIFRERLDVERRYREVRSRQLGHTILGRAHVLCADRVLVHARNDRGAARSAHRSCRECVCVADRFAREPIQHWSARQRVAVRSDVRAHVFVRNPDDVRPRGRLTPPPAAPPARARDEQQTRVHNSSML